MDEQTHSETFRGVVEAHQRVVDQWRDEHPIKISRLESITKQHTQDALYRPYDYCWDLEREFYAEVDAMRRVRD